MTTLNQEQIQAICDKWIHLFKLEPWKIKPTIDNKHRYWEINLDEKNHIIGFKCPFENLERKIIQALISFTMVINRKDSGSIAVHVFPDEQTAPIADVMIRLDRQEY